jgi:hypothetical protein
MTGLSNTVVMNTIQPGSLDQCTTAGKPGARLYSGIFLLAACLFALPVSADMFFGMKAGSMMVDVASDKNPRNLALNLRYQLDTQLADLSLGGEVNRTMHEGETRRGEDLEFESEAIYLLWKTPRSLFVSFRGGIARDKVIIDNNESKDDGLMLGAGFGVIVGKSIMQIEYTSIAGDADYLSFSLEF